MVEANHTAIECARQNVTDARAVFYWQDVSKWLPDTLVNTVVTNPPFHTSRAADPDLGRAFIAAAARVLKPSGEMWLVSNRHLPYETTISRHFAGVEEVASNNRFKVLRATRPSRNAR